MSFKFEIVKKSKKSKARVGKLYTSHGVIDTPAFLPVGTQATVKAASPRILEEVGVQAIISNMYHLYLRPGVEIIKKAGGLHKFMNWKRPIVTDSGGFQIFSLAPLRKVTDEGVEFSSHIDGSKHFLTPEKVVEIQQALGADIMMPLDECVAYPCTLEQAREALRRTREWAKRGYQVMGKSGDQVLFGIIQGATFPELRRKSAEEIVSLDFPGYAIGGLSVGEPREKMYEMLEVVSGLLPQEKPAHLLGVGYTEDILGSVSYGIDLFDCVVATRVARHGSFLLREGRKSIRDAEWKEDFSPLDKDCDCYACRNFTKAYLRHLFWAREILALQLLTLHNLRFLTRLMHQIREEILNE